MTEPPAGLQRRVVALARLYGETTGPADDSHVLSFSTAGLAAFTRALGGRYVTDAFAKKLLRKPCIIEHIHDDVVSPLVIPVVCAELDYHISWDDISVQLGLHHPQACAVAELEAPLEKAGYLRISANVQ